MTLGEFCEHVAIAGMRYEGSVISWGRSAKRNHKVGGHPDSFHLSFQAADVTFDEPAGAQAAKKYWKRMGLATKDNGESGLSVHVQIVPVV